MVRITEKRREWQHMKLDKQGKTFLSGLTTVFLVRIVGFYLIFVY